MYFLGFLATGIFAFGIFRLFQDSLPSFFDLAYRASNLWYSNPRKELYDLEFDMILDGRNVHAFQIRSLPPDYPPVTIGYPTQTWKSIVLKIKIKGKEHLVHFTYRSSEEVKPENEITLDLNKASAFHRRLTAAWVTEKIITDFEKDNNNSPIDESFELVTTHLDKLAGPLGEFYTLYEDLNCDKDILPHLGKILKKENINWNTMCVLDNFGKLHFFSKTGTFTWNPQFSLN